jgi:general secretion pathway protein K
VTPVNVNTASVEVLAARLGTLSDATTLIASRKQAYIRDLADLTSRLRGQSKELTSNEVSVATNFFLVNGNVRLSRAALQVQSLVERNSNKVTVIWIRENETS